MTDRTVWNTRARTTLTWTERSAGVVGVLCWLVYGDVVALAATLAAWAFTDSLYRYATEDDGMFARNVNRAFALTFMGCTWACTYLLVDRAL